MIRYTADVPPRVDRDAMEKEEGFSPFFALDDVMADEIDRLQRDMAEMRRIMRGVLALAEVLIPDETKDSESVVPAAAN